MWRRSVTGRRAALGGIAVIVVGCTPRGITKPEAPDMAPLVQSYEFPSASFESSDAGELRSALTVFDALMERTEIASRVFEVLENIVGETDVGDETEQAEDEGVDLTIEADGFLRITRICNGWVVPPVADADANGELELTATFTELGLDPVTWGNATRCRYLAGETQLELRQSPGSEYAVSVYWGAGVDLEALAERPLLVAMNLLGEIDDEQLDLRFDFRTVTGNEIEYRIETDEGSLVASVAEDGTLAVRARNGIFACPAEMPCAELDGRSGGLGD
jgi:hypothetical protein